MKPLRSTLILVYTLVLHTVLFAQSNPYSKPAEQHYTPMNLSGFESAIRQKQQSHDKNNEYISALQNYILKLKSEVTERTLLDDLTKCQNQLNAIDRRDLSNAQGKISAIEADINMAINRYNTRIANLPYTLWDSAKSKINAKQYSEALVDLNQIISIKPDFTSVYKQRGLIYYKYGKWNDAISDLEFYLSVEKWDGEIYHEMGWAKYQIGDYSGALQAFNNQVSFDPNNPLAYYNKGSAKSGLGDHYGAITDYTKAIELRPSFSMAYNNRGWAKFKLSKNKEALSDLNQAIELDNKNSVAWDSRQEVKFAMGDYNGCVSDCTEAIKLNPKMSNSYLHRGKAYQKLGKKDLACQDYSMSGELGISQAYELIRSYCNK